jgi:hypothetical protein
MANQKIKFQVSYKRLALFLLIIFQSMTLIKVSANPLVFYLDDFKPIAYLENGIHKGILVEWIELITDELKIPYTIALAPTARIYESFNKNSEVDASIQVLTPQLRQVTFPVVSLPSYPVAIFTLKENTIYSIADLHDKTICQVRGATYGSRYDTDTKILKHKVSTYTQIIEMVIRKRCFAGVGVIVPLEIIMKSLDYSLSTFSKPMIIYELPLTLIISKDRFDEDFISKMRNAVLKLKSEQAFQKIVNQQYEVKKD